MTDPKQTEKPAAAATPKPSADAKKRDTSQTQVDEAKDEGAGKKSVPIDEVTTANDE